MEIYRQESENVKMGNELAGKVEKNARRAE